MTNTGWVMDSTEARKRYHMSYSMQGPAVAVADEHPVEAEARQWCEDHGHSLRKRGRNLVADEDCLHRVNMAQDRAVELCAERHGRGQGKRDYCGECLHDAAVEALSRPRAELPPLPGRVKDPMVRHLDELFRTGGKWQLAGLTAALNRYRETHPELRTRTEVYTETATSARIRDLRKAGRHIDQGPLEGGGAEYWMPEVVDLARTFRKPGQEFTRAAIE